ncbi:hypothetical protein K469DRAFT_703629 [Zopfia rhizophila CBS 207.26]|uniref:Uncharacterized protein n=1 Tax=Zopfia rhizophila CBS 207.26 TaxID=1314779 RepID=A0A6A6EC79_9PEZI|nr:hypothetical protein K469DRAFT_703629 [Zopfia rhizophila CBS 207.26]
MRLEIFNQVLDVSKVPTSYGYTDAESHAKSTRPPWTKHGMVLVSKQFSAEYRQAFYERTRFFLRVDGKNAYRADQALLRSTPGQDLLNSWNTPVAFLSSLRHCTLYIEIGDIAASPESSHSISQIVKSASDLKEAKRVRNEMKMFQSLDTLKYEDVFFDDYLKMSVSKLVDQMQQLRSIHLVWETTVPYRSGQRFFTSTAANWTWDAPGKPFVERLKEKWNLRELRVKVRDKYGDTMIKAERGEGGKWGED